MSTAGSILQKKFTTKKKNVKKEAPGMGTGLKGEPETQHLPCQFDPYRESRQHKSEQLKTIHILVS